MSFTRLIIGVTVAAAAVSATIACGRPPHPETSNPSPTPVDPGGNVYLDLPRCADVPPVPAPRIAEATRPDSALGTAGSLVVLVSGVRREAYGYLSVILYPVAGQHPDSTGVARFGRVPPGTYHFRASAIGYRHVSMPFVIRQGFRDTVEVTLRLACM